MDDLDRIDVNGDSTLMLMLEAQRRGWPVFMCHPRELFLVQGQAHATVRSVEITTDRQLKSGSSKQVDLGFFQVIWLRKDPPFDMDYIFSTYILEMTPKETMVFNHPASVRSANEKLFALQWPNLSPPTLICRQIEHARSWAEQWSKVVIKPWDGNGGRGVLVSSYSDPNFRSMLEILTENEQQHIIVQKYLPEKLLRVTSGLSLWMVCQWPGWRESPQPGDHRGNMHVGARVASFELSERDREICSAIGPTLKAQGLLFVGIDIIGSYLTEINVTSPTGIQELNPMFNIRIEEMLTDSCGVGL